MCLFKKDRVGPTGSLGWFRLSAAGAAVILLLLVNG